jgi:ketosteroid isomerase-like protein
MKLTAIFLMALVVLSCTQRTEVSVVEETEALLGTDREFASASVANGAAEAFNDYLLDEAVMLSEGRSPVEGREAIYEIMRGSQDTYTLDWKPVAGEVSKSGEMGYTWGEYTVSAADSNGVIQKNYGKYLNVWKKNSEGEWRVLVDIGNQSPPPDER